MELDEEAEKSAVFAKRSYIYPYEAPLPVSNPNVFIGNFDEKFEGDALYFDAYDLHKAVKGGPPSLTLLSWTSGISSIC